MDHGLDRLPRHLSIAAISAACLLASSFVLGTTASAQNADAELLFASGDSLMKQGKLAEACGAFEASNRIETRAGTLIRLGECREKNHEFASAWSAYKDALNRVKDANKKALATAKVVELEPKLSYLTVSVPDDSRVDGLVVTRNNQPLDPALWNRAVPVNGGEYVIGGRAPGHDEWKTTVTVPNESGKITVKTPKLNPQGKLATPNVPDKPPTAPRPKPSSTEDDDDKPPTTSATTWTTKRKAAIGMAGVSVAGVVTGILLGTQATGKRDDAHTLCPDPATPCADAARADALIKSGQSRALAANVGFGIAGVAAIVAGVLWFTGAPETPTRRVAVIPSIAPGATTISVFGRF